MIRILDPRMVSWVLFDFEMCNEGIFEILVGLSVLFV